MTFWPKFIAVMVLLGALFGIFHAGKRSGLAEGRLELSAYKQQISDETERELLRIRKESDALQNNADDANKRLKVVLRDSAIEHDELVKRLQSRAPRPVGADSVPANPGAGASAARATGAELYKEDGQFLAGEAARADKLRTYLAVCEAAYARAKAAVNK